MFRTVGNLIARAAPALVVILVMSLIVGTLYAYVTTNKDPFVLQCTVDDIVVCQNSYAYTEDKEGHRTRVATLMSMQYANAEIVKTWFKNHGYDVTAETSLHEYHKGDVMKETVPHSNVTTMDEFVIVGRIPPFREMRIRDGDVTIALDPEYQHPSDSNKFPWYLQSDLQRLASRIRYNEAR